MFELKRVYRDVIDYLLRFLLLSSNLNLKSHMSQLFDAFLKADPSASAQSLLARLLAILLLMRLVLLP